MFKEVEINNFQSHRKTRLNLSEGINLFTGNSDCGKSAMMRALLWTITNRPSGDSFVSNAIKDSKGKVKGETSVTIDGVARIKGKDFNGYDVEGTKYEALRTDVPADIADKLNIKDVNIQRQLDGPFMLSNTPGENAKYINSLVNLEVIDDANYWVSSKVRDAKTEQKYIAENLDNLERKLYDEDKIQQLQKLSDTLNSLRNNEQDLLCGINEIFTEICQYENILATIPDSEKVKSLEDKIIALDELQKTQLPMYVDIKNIQEGIAAYSESEYKKPNENAVLRLENLKEYIYTSCQQKTDLQAVINELSGNISVVESIKIPPSEKVWKLGDDILPNIYNLQSMAQTLMAEIGDIAKKSTEYNSMRSKIMHLQPLLDESQEELKSMACPLCGRRDCSDGYRSWIDR